MKDERTIEKNKLYFLSPTVIFYSKLSTKSLRTYIFIGNYRDRLNCRFFLLLKITVNIQSMYSQPSYNVS